MSIFSQVARPDPGVCTRVTFFYFVFSHFPICLLGFFRCYYHSKAQKGVGVVCGNNLMQAILRIQVSALSASSAIADAWVVSLCLFSTFFPALQEWGRGVSSLEKPLDLARPFLVVGVLAGPACCCCFHLGPRPFLRGEELDFSWDPRVVKCSRDLV